MSRNNLAAETVLVLVLLCVALTSCNAYSSQQPIVEDGTSGIEPSLSQFPALGDLPRDTAAIAGYSQLGREFTAAIDRNLVVAVGDQAEFSPSGSQQLWEMAYAGYHFKLLDESGTQQMQFEWAVPPVIELDEPLFWVGLSNWDTNRWQWFSPEDAVNWTIPEITPYIQSGTGNCYVILLLCGTGQALLDEFGFPDATAPVLGPHVNSVQPRCGQPGAEVTFVPEYFSPHSFDVSWDFGGACTPNTSTEPFPAVTLGSTGVYNCNVSVSNEHGSDSLVFTFIVSDELYFACGLLGEEMSPPLGSFEVGLTGSLEMSVDSDDDGWFAFPNLPNGNYTATPVGDNWVPHHIDFTIDDNYQTQLYFDLWDNQPLHGISGTIIDHQGVSMKFAEVQLTGEVERTNNTVNFSGLTDGNYRVTPVLSGWSFYPEFQDVTLYKVTRFGVSFQASPEPLSTFTVNGTVTEAGSGLPAAGIWIELRGTYQISALTDEHGFYEVTGVPDLPLHTWRVKPYRCQAAAEFAPIMYGLLDVGDTTGKDFVMSALE